MTANYLIEGATWRGPRSGRMAVVPVRITTALLTRIRARGIPVSKFLREAGEKAADTRQLMMACEQAADEIARLREELRQVRRALQCYNPDHSLLAPGPPEDTP